LQPPFSGRLAGKVALVTGAARGLGAAIATRFVNEGATVHLADIADADGIDCVKQLAATGAPAHYHHLDVTDEAQWQSTLAEIGGAQGRIDILVNNAAIAVPFVPVEERRADEWDRVMAVNAKSVFLGSKYVIPIMRRGGGGSIVNISSAAGLGQWQIMEGAYAASKAAVHVLTKVVATQQASDGIRCNSVHPGPIDSEMAQAVLGADPAVMSRRLSRVPMGRMAEMQEVVAAVLFLASDEASFITGAELSVDGGAVAQ
jgi:cyclopentanol dehydrogenase